MLFKIKADAEFEAKNIDDAFRRLSTHFMHLYRGSTFKGGVKVEPEDLFIGGSIKIERLEEQHDASNSM